MANFNDLASRQAPQAPQQFSATTLVAEPHSFEIELRHDERGIIVSNPLEILSDGVLIKSSEIDDGELRRALLFWDKIVWPSNNAIMLGGGPDVDFLLAEGVLKRPHFLVNGHAERAVVLSFSNTFRALERRHPGRWIMSNGEKSLQFEGKELVQDRGALCQLTNAIPVPSRNVPLEDILNFRAKRRDEVLALRAVLDGFYQSWVNSEDKEHALQAAVRQLDTECSAMIRIARETRLPFCLSSWRLNFSISQPAIVALTSQLFELSAVNAVLAFSASTLSIGRDVGIRTKNENSPFNYIASIERDLF